jgi:hypothetical protein
VRVAGVRLPEELHPVRGGALSVRAVLQGHEVILRGCPLHRPSDMARRRAGLV